MNVAARLEQAAGAGEIFLGDDTLELVRDAVSTDPVDLTLKGKPGTVPAHRLRELDASAAASRGTCNGRWSAACASGTAPRRLRDVVAGSTCRLFTLIGSAGIGKSRLVADFLERVEGSATIAQGRALRTERASRTGHLSRF